ncbi:hypothetical protein ASPVEDRAFT_172673 [Aspergillus versicolor CBS 583.65]|uniref:C2H2-type domain-containing protein n=1 Tax=Aspergillus versicolor CBS 583.65 TaxID=1036611 RepID=A0A1L9PSK8_ASPVE|nr:uncharacterized protein ASPVEDRAFT_172673 [Aspergillus versicolor CBS 583.65]OJJ04442.1 hypothetical protein ASPVEDRAFT_172673 [Aspergillus versicolor CBS 583.65]
MSKGKQTTNLPPNGGRAVHCHTCQRSFTNADALGMHCRSSKVHQENKSAPSPSPSSADKPTPSPTNKDFMCIQCNRQFKDKAALRSHKRNSRKHKTASHFPLNVSSNTTKAAVSGSNERVIALEPGTGKSTAENNSIEEEVADFQHQPRPYPLPRRQIHPAKTSGPNGDSHIDIDFTTVEILVDALIPAFFESLDEAKPDNPVASVPENQEGGTNSETHELGASEVPAPWSRVPLNERDVVLNALQAKCHTIGSLAREGYWTQTPSPVDIDMRRQCSDCGVEKRRISTHPEESVCRFHPARKPFQDGIIRGRGTPMPKKSRCVNCKQPGSSKGCIVYSSHAFAPPNANLGKMAPTPAYNREARKAVVIDCEMVGVLGASGRECSVLVRVSAVDFLSGELILDTYVSPQGKVISWRTKFSGVNRSVLEKKNQEGKVVKGWQAARDLLWQFIDAQTVLIGHSLNNDLAVLGMVHTRVVDSAIITRVAVGEDCKRWKLQKLVQQFLDLSIQAGDEGHDCVEDTYAAREVILWCLRNASGLQAWADDERRTMAGNTKEGTLSQKPSR